MKLIDSFGRVHTSVRISVTDRCNIRCFYCMPEFGAEFAPRESLLSFEEITRLTRLLVNRLGIRDVRITGGEPLVRRDLPVLIQQIAAIDGLKDLSLTTNGILLAEQAQSLRDAGLRRLNISLDTLDADVFKEIARRDGLEKTIEGIDAAIDAGFDSIKLNSLAIAGVTEAEIARLVRFAMDRSITIRFIEFMPLDADREWSRGNVLSGDRILEILKSNFGDIAPIIRSDPSAPAEDFLVGGGTVGIIRSVTQPFCGACNRIRVTADGSIRNCLFANEETPLRDLMRAGADEEELIRQIQASVANKKASHGMDSDSFDPPERPMYSIGG
ncbi:Cyclic pyranopterin monophosphate synthase [Rubripirellula obstinata]|uniref:GTP 3',8-cyclase n=1 Tax=Rubripirellula obstinata TaxID=406547 RepID=A0A5B1CPT3_9BACT|nr:GTP 3',8-cyclase MoaA [Rubripirellula obstinata]KAA1262392.1 Cyclic pyranopterin monophosphate synthase [Rubripirellula obstinata]